MSLLEEHMQKYLKVAPSKQGFLVCHHGKIKINKPRPQEENCRPLKIGYLLDYKFQMPEDAFI